MAVAASSLQPMSYNYTSTVDFINKRQFDEKFYDRYPGQGMIKLFELMGRSNPISGVKKEWVERDRILQSITAAANVTAPGAGANLVVTLSAASHRDSGVNSYPRVNQIVLLKNNKQGQVMSVNKTTPGAHVLTIKPLRAADDLGAVTAGDYIIFPTNAYSEGSNQGSGLTPIPLNFAAQTQIFKEDFLETSTSGLTQTWYTLTGPNGEQEARWGLEGEAETFKRYNVAVSLAMLLQEQADAGYTGPDGIVTRTTQGLLPFIRSGGNSFSVGGFALATMDTIIKALNKQRGAKENIMPMGIDFMTTVDGLLTAQMKNDVTSYDFFAKAADTNKIDAGKQRSAMFGFDHFKKSGYTFHMYAADDFNEENMLGATGYSYSNKGLILPADRKAITVDGKASNADCISIMYQELNGKSRKYDHWITGGGTNVPVDRRTDGMDLARLHYRSEQGFMGVAANRFAIIE